MIVFVDCNSNHIRIVPVKSQKSEHPVEAHKRTHEWCEDGGFEAQPLQLDNETSKLMIQAIKENNQDYQLTSPSDHHPVGGRMLLNESLVKSEGTQGACRATSSHPSGHGHASCNMFVQSDKGLHQMYLQ